MANPSPQHNPTDGLGTAVKLLVTSNDANFSTQVANHEYTQTISLTAATYNGVSYASTATLTGAIKDIAGTSFSSGNSNTTVWKSYNTSVATINASTGVIAGVKAGEVILEAQFDSFDAGSANSMLSNGKVYAQVRLVVLP